MIGQLCFMQEGRVKYEVEKRLCKAGRERRRVFENAAVVQSAISAME